MRASVRRICRRSAAGKGTGLSRPTRRHLTFLPLRTAVAIRGRSQGPHRRNEKQPLGTHHQRALSQAGSTHGEKGLEQTCLIEWEAGLATHPKKCNLIIAAAHEEQGSSIYRWLLFPGTASAVQAVPGPGGKELVSGRVVNSAAPSQSWVLDGGCPKLPLGFLHHRNLGPSNARHNGYPSLCRPQSPTVRAPGQFTRAWDMMPVPVNVAPGTSTPNAISTAAEDRGYPYHPQHISTPGIRAIPGTPLLPLTRRVAYWNWQLLELLPAAAWAGFVRTQAARRGRFMVVWLGRGGHQRGQRLLHATSIWLPISPATHRMSRK